MTNAQRLLFIQYQLEMLASAISIANQNNEVENYNVLYSDLRNNIRDMLITLKHLQSS